MRQVKYGPGGFIPNHPSLNERERWDSSTDTYTSYDAAGNVLEQRALTADEAAALTPPPPSAAELLRAEIAALPAPTMPADVLDVLDRALALLDGA